VEFEDEPLHQTFSNPLGSVVGEYCKHTFSTPMLNECIKNSIITPYTIFLAELDVLLFFLTVVNDSRPNHLVELYQLLRAVVENFIISLILKQSHKQQYKAPFKIF